MYLDEYYIYKLNDILKSNKKFELLIHKYIIKKYKKNLVFLDNTKQVENDENLYIDLDAVSSNWYYGSVTINFSNNLIYSIKGCN
jgi:hypothetical protein